MPKRFQQHLKIVLARANINSTLLFFVKYTLYTATCINRAVMIIW